MDIVKECEERLQKFAGISGPYESGIRMRALAMLIKHHAEIQQVEQMGMEAIPDPDRRLLMQPFLGNEKNFSPKDVGFSIWVLNHAIGKQLPGAAIFYRCQACAKIRTYRAVQKGPCKCGSTRLNGAVGNIQPKQAIAALAAGM